AVGQSETDRKRAYGRRRARGCSQPRAAVASAKCQYPERDRHRVRDNAATARGRASRWCRSVPFQPAPANCCISARDAIPSMHTNREYTEEGGLMSYGNDTADSYRRAGVYVGRILNGASPADLPVDQATKFELVVNVKAAKAIGLTIPE